MKLKMPPMARVFSENEGPAGPAGPPEPPVIDLADEEEPPFIGPNDEEDDFWARWEENDWNENL